MKYIKDEEMKRLKLPPVDALTAVNDLIDTYIQGQTIYFNMVLGFAKRDFETAISNREKIVSEHEKRGISGDLYRAYLIYDRRLKAIGIHSDRYLKFRDDVLRKYGYGIDIFDTAMNALTENASKTLKNLYVNYASK